MGSVQLILFLIIKLFGQINGEDIWNEPNIILSDEASRLNVVYQREIAGFRLDIPEFDHIGNNFSLGVFNFVGTKVYVTGCNSFGPGQQTSINPFITTETNQSESIIYNPSFDYEDVREKNISHFICFLSVDKVDCKNATSPCKDLYVYIGNINDNAPKFVGESFTKLNFSENTAKADVHLYEASDYDELGDLVFTVYSDDGRNVTDKFEMIRNDNFSSYLSIKDLNFEEQYSYQLVIKVQDLPDEYGTVREATQRLEVRVIDENDMPPKWGKPPPSTFNLEENIQINTNVFTITAFDGDTEINHKIEYKIVNITYAGVASYTFLTVDEASGEVTVSEEIDREKFTSIDNVFYVYFRATEKDCTGDCQIEITSVGILKDLDDNNPSLTINTNEITMPENPIQNYISGLEVFATDLDSDIANSQFYIELTNPSEDGVLQALTVEPPSGVKNVSMQFIIKKKEFFDYETRQTFSFDVIVKKKKEDTTIQDSKTITINLTDMNDNEPVFEKSNYTFTVKEDLSNFEEPFKEIYSLVTVKATDADLSEQYGEKSIRYSFSQPPSLPLTINNETGEISLNVAESAFNIFDYEMAKSHQVRISAINFGDPTSATATTILTIIVDDINDEKPNVASNLDVQTACTYENSTDGWPETFPLTCTNLDLIEITGTDVDTESELLLEIDWDATVAKKRYLPVPISRYNYTKCFVVKTISGEGTSEVLGKIETGEEFIDREFVDEIILQINVVDRTTKPGKDSTATVSIPVTILDLDDTAPEFLDQPWKFRIEEYDSSQGGNATGQNLTQRIQVKDEDNGQQFFFKLTGDSVSDGLITFKENPTNSSEGILQVSKLIDRENADIDGQSGILTYTLTVSDAAGNSRSEQISIEVVDLNDCIPEFEQAIYNISIKEELDIGTPVLTIRATDKDINENYHTVYYPELQMDVPFDINRATGEITVSGRVDFESSGGQSYTFTVVAKDNDGWKANSNSVAVTIHLEDINDNAPELDESKNEREIFNDFSFTSTPILQYQATDKDSGINKELTFKALNLDSLFDVTPDGQLFANKSLQGLHDRFEFNLTVTDGGVPPMQDWMICAINVKDKNDQKPIFTFPANPEDSVKVYQNSTAGAILRDIKGNDIIFKAYDEDTFEPYRTVYFEFGSSVQDEVKELFDIKKTSGELWLLKTFDTYPQIQFQFDVVAYDNNPEQQGETSLRSFSNLVVKTTKNEQPIFNEKSTTMYFKEGPIEGITPQKIPLATDDQDALEEDEEQICYYIFERPEEFSINKTAGLVSVEMALDRESISKYNLTVIATNECWNEPTSLDGIGEKSRLQLQIEVQDINDETPKFEAEFYSWSISVDDPSQWANDVKAIDDDLNEDLNFSFASGFVASNDSQGLDGIAEPFQIADNTDSKSAKVTSNFKPTAGMKGHYDFKIKAMDKAGHSETTDVRVVIIATENQFEVTLHHPQNIELRVKVKEAFEVSFEGWIFNIDSIESISERNFVERSTKWLSSFFDDSTKSGDTVMTKSKLKCNFVDEKNFDPINKYDVYEKYETVFVKLNQELNDRALVLDRTNGFDVGGSVVDETGFDIPQGLSLAAIIVGSILLIMVIFLGIAYKLRVSHLERRIKASSAFGGSKGSDINKLDTDAIPGTNVNAVKGANPIWDPDSAPNAPPNAYLTDLDLKNGKLNSLYRKDDDDIGSLSSGDSVLIGVENQAEFRGYKDMDFDNFDTDSSGSDTIVDRKPNRRTNISIFLRPAYEDGQAIRQNPLYNDESAL